MWTNLRDRKSRGPFMVFSIGLKRYNQLGQCNSCECYLLELYQLLIVKISKGRGKGTSESTLFFLQGLSSGETSWPEPHLLGKGNTQLQPPQATLCPWERAGDWGPLVKFPVEGSPQDCTSPHPTPHHHVTEGLFTPRASCLPANKKITTISETQNTIWRDWTSNQIQNHTWQECWNYHIGNFLKWW